LAIIWAAGAAVLMIAGAGVRNLVALTQRRMQFAYAVTHELRTPLTTFRLYSDMLSAGLVPHESQQEYLDTLNRESVRLSKLVEEVLEYARLENQNVRLNVTNTDAPSLLRVVSEPLDRLCAQNGVDGRTFNNIPNGQVIRTDVNLVSQIAGVLVNNACRHARDASRPTVVMTLGGEADRVYLDVIDSGPGIDRSDARKIFRPFRRGRDADRSARGGIGLGLALARNWATLLGGRLDLIARHHAQYNGAHFRLTIPSHQPA
jgi:signal transduction histidine kinase